MAEVASRDSNRIPVLLAASATTQVPTQVYVDPLTHRLYVDASITVDNLTVSQNIAQIGGASIVLGQALMASSFPVAIASNQTAIPVTGTFFQATQPVSIASLPALPAGTNVIGHVIVDSGALTVNTISGFALETGGNLATLAGTVGSSKVNVNISTGSIANTSFASTIADGADATLGAKADARSTATDITAVSIMSVLKEISYMTQNPASTPVTGTFYQATQPVSIASTVIISGAVTEATLDAAIISQEATTSGVKGITIFGAVTTAKPTYTTAKSDALSLDVNGLLRISLADTPANTNKFLVTADAISIASSQTLATVTTVTTVSNLSQIASTTPTFGDINNSATETGALNTAPIGRYNATQPTLTDTRYNQLQVSLRGELLVSPGVSNFAVQATLATETTKVIGTVNISSGQTIGLAAGSEVIGHVIVDSGTITTVTAVTAITNALPAGTNLIGNVGHGKTIKTATGSIASSGDNTIVNAVTSKRIKVIAYALFYASTTSNTLTFKDNTAGTGVWTVILQAPAANTVFGANLATNAPSFLFASLAGDPLVLNLSQAVSVTYSISYYDDDAS